MLCGVTLNIPLKKDWFLSKPNVTAFSVIGFTSEIGLIFYTGKFLHSLLSEYIFSC